MKTSYSLLGLNAVEIVCILSFISPVCENCIR